MEKSLFAGLTILEPGESLSTDNGAFIGPDRRTIDKLLEIGAKTHRHTGLDGLTNPTAPASAGVVASAGTLAAGLGISVGYTLEDANGGETMLSPVAAVSTRPPLSGPTAAPSGVADYTGGALQVNTYFYALTWGDGEGGETALGPAVTVERAPGFASGQIKLSQLNFGMAAAGAVQWRLYRATGGGTYNLLAVGGVGTSTFTDDGEQAIDCDVHPPVGEENTTLGISTLLVKLPSGVQAGTSFINLYASITGDFSGGSFLAQYPLSSAGQLVAFSTLELSAASPPSTNHSFGGAHQIDPDSEILDWHWRKPVNASGLLGSGTVGDVKLAKDTGNLYAILAPRASAAGPAEWVRIASAGGGGSVSTQLGASAMKVAVASGGLGFMDRFGGNKMDGNWSEEFGKLNFLTVAGGVLKPSKKIEGIGILMGRGPRWSDGRVIHKLHTGANKSGTGLLCGLRARCKTGTNEGVGFTISDEGFAVIENEVSNEVLAEKVAPTIQKNKDYWVVYILDGNDFRMELWEVDPDTPEKEPIFILTATVKGAEIAQIGNGVYGDIRWWLPPVETDWSWDDFQLIPGDVFRPGTLEFVGASGIVVLASGYEEGRPQITIAASGLGAGSTTVFGSGSAVAGVSVLNVDTLELIGSGGVNVKESENGKGKAKVTLEGQAATLGDKGVGVMVLRTAEKSAPRPPFKMVIWYCKEKPTNMATFDQWVEEGP